MEKGGCSIFTVYCTVYVYLRAFCSSDQSFPFSKHKRTKGNISKEGAVPLSHYREPTKHFLPSKNNGKESRQNKKKGGEGIDEGERETDQDVMDHWGKIICQPLYPLPNSS